MPAVQASPALPPAARGGAQWQEAAALKPVSAAPDQTARHPAGRGRRDAGRALTSRPAPARPIGGRAPRGGPCVPGKGPRRRQGWRGVPGSPRSAFPAALEPQRPEAQRRPGGGGAWTRALVPKAPLEQPSVGAGAALLSSVLHHWNVRGTSRPAVFWELPAWENSGLTCITHAQLTKRGFGDVRGLPCPPPLG